VNSFLIVSTNVTREFFSVYISFTCQQGVSSVGRLDVYVVAWRVMWIERLVAVRPVCPADERRESLVCRSLVMSSERDKKPEWSVCSCWTLKRALREGEWKALRLFDSALACSGHEIPHDDKYDDD
jgi:hypothetical protein